MSVCNEHVVDYLRHASAMEADADKSNRLRFASYKEEDHQLGVVDDRTYEQFMEQAPAMEADLYATDEDFINPWEL